MRRAAIPAIVFAAALLLRLGGDGRIPPFDDAYHWKRILWTAQQWPRVLTFDPDRGVGGELVPWPPLYDWASGTLAAVVGPSAVPWFPPVGFALLCAVVAAGLLPLGRLPASVAGLGLAAAPYLIAVSQPGAFDHHWVEPFLLLAIVAARRRPLLLALAMTVALLVQTALIIGCGLAFVVCFLFDEETWSAARAFALAALAIAAYTLLQPPPPGPWFLGWTHVALLDAAALSLALRPRWYALPVGAAVMLPFIPAIVTGLGFFRGDPWLQSIAEFQPMLRHVSTIGTDLANLGGGVLALAVLILHDRQSCLSPLGIAEKRTKEDRRDCLSIALFATVYLLLAISSRRFLVPGIGVFVIAGAIAASSRKRALAIVAVLATLLPPLAYDAWSAAGPPMRDRAAEVESIAHEVAPLPSGRMLAPWHAGHAIDVFGRHAVVIDNFGSMAGESLFANANEALLQKHPEVLTAWCVRNGVRYVAFPDVQHIPAAAVCAGVDAAFYRSTRLARSTVWWRLRSGEAVPGFRRVALDVWEVE